MRQFLEILLDGDSMLSEVRALRLDRRSDQAVDALTLELAGYALYSEFNFGALPASPRIQVGSAAGDPKTDGATAGGGVLTSASSNFVTQGVTTDDLLLILDSSVPGDIGAWPITNIAATQLTSSHTFGSATGVDFIVLTNQGRFFIEKPDVAEDQNSLTIPSLWGRSALARMIDPFAPKISRTWKVPTSFYEVTRELVREAGMDDLKIQFDIDDYPIPQDLLSVTGQYSLQIIMDLAGKTNGYVRNKKSGDLWVKRERFHFGALSVAVTLGDADVQEARTRIEYPEFGNRILIRSSVPNASQPLRVTIKAPNGCLRGDGRAKMVVEAIVVDNEGKPAANGTLVEWTIDNGTLAHFGLVRSETGEKFIISEPQRASGLQSLSTDYPIGQVVGVFLEEDFPKGTDFFGAGGTFDGTQIELEFELPFTDSRLVVDYVAKGVASSTLFTNAGAPEQETEIHVAIGRIRDSATFCINNQRNVTIKMSANITEHNLCVPGQLSSQVLAEVDIDGQGGSGAMVQWFLAGPGSVTPPFSPVTNAIIEGEVGRAVNTFEVATKHKIVAVIGVWLLEAGRMGTNFFATRQQRRGSFADNKIILGTDLPDDGAQVMIDYRANGIARAVFTATDIVGRSTITARVRDGTSANFEESIEIETVNRCAEGGQTPQEPPGGEKNCNDSVSVAVGCNAATYPNPINATVEECICRQESFGAPCPDNEEDCRALCEQLYNKYGLDPLSCESRVTDDEREEMEEQIGVNIPAIKAKAYRDCIKECDGNPDCIDPCVDAHREATVNRCTKRCLDHGVLISPAEGSINCTGAKTITFTAKGGKPPYSWSASVGVLTVGEDGNSAVLKPPANTGGLVAGTAYSFVIGYATISNGSCLDAHAFQDFNCRDEGVGSCQQAVNAGGFFTCDGVVKDWCDFTKCNEDSGNGICNTGCMNGFPRQSAPCSTCNPVQFGEVCDRRTPMQISQGCQPCSVLFADGGIVTVRDSQGLAATAVVTP
jgi:hypothetical protein